VHAWAAAAAEGDELAVADEEGGWGAGGVEGRELGDLAGVRVEVEGPVLVALIDDSEIAGDGGGDIAGVGDGDSSSVHGPDGAVVLLRAKTIEVDLDGILLFRFRSRRTEEGSLRLLVRRDALDGLDDEEIGFGREDQGRKAALGRDEEGILGEGMTGGEIGERGEGGEGIADTEEEMAMAKIPEVLGVVMEVPGGAGENLSGRELEQEGVDDTVLIVLGLVGQAGDEAVGDEGKENMLIVNVVEREHRAAVEQELWRKRLEAEVFQWDTKSWLGDAGEDRRRDETEDADQSNAEKAVLYRIGPLVRPGNRHGIGAYFYTIDTRRSNVSQTQDWRQRMQIVTGSVAA
jgi:hypothetical protein